ncbi:MAG: acetyl-CoA decarbonylase/synthase complex subunit delta, partial [Defluviitaleaceae bacterium]|nr:acetyl-CoA decarbonylase/synthase complex subunit delta [Defluviitaleaceae bacterium]
RDMSEYAVGTQDDEPEPAAKSAAEAPKPAEAPKAEATEAPSKESVEQIKAKLTGELREEIKKEVLTDVIGFLIKNLSGIDSTSHSIPGLADLLGKPAEAESGAIAKAESAPYVSAASRLGALNKVEIHKEKWDNRVWTVKLGATIAEGGTRGVSYEIGGATAMPFHLWEGESPNRPLVAMEVFDRVSEKYPEVLRKYFGDVLSDPAKMAKRCVEEFGADLISVRLDGTHPERGDKNASESAEMVASVLAEVSVPLIITGHNHYEKNNEVMKAVAQRFEGENLLFNWVEQDNYRTIAGAAIAYGHSIVAQSPIDVNIGKQLNILLTNMDVKTEKIVMDPMTSAIGYGIEYTYSVMERIRLTGLGGDKMLCAPMIASTGQECIKIKEFKADEAAFPNWGNLAKRAALWEASTAISLLYAGADILIMYHPEAVRGVKKTIRALLDEGAY